MQLALGLEAFVGGLAAERAVRAVEGVAVPPCSELVVEETGVVDDDTGERAVELLGVDPVRALDLAVEVGTPA
ncbi:hypothetical protein [Kitasatospora sp. NPDC059327]|uniref:hypothetical protein n=1 Tax=Kitasatospora sp. NPDC059327 TaxID=3346803 RepID=UPI003685C605